MTEGGEVEPSGHAFRVSQLRIPRLSEVDFPGLRRNRLQRLQEAMKAHELAVCLFFNPATVRYATGAPMMDAWAATTFARAALVPASGQPILYEFEVGIPVSSRVVADVRPVINWSFAGDQARPIARRWVREVKSALQELGLADEPLGLDKLDMPGFLAMADEGVRLVDAGPAVVDAREVKTAEEVDLFKINGAIGDAILAAVEANVRPGIREYELLAIATDTLLRFHGETLFTRLITSGTNTNPWLQEANDKLVMPGDLVAVDTDANGFEGYVIDVSRTFLCGSSPSPAQREAYRVAHECVTGMVDLVRPGMSYSDFVYGAPRLPDKFVAQRYSVQAHQSGLEDEGPFFPYPEDVERGAVIPDRILQENMILNVECYAGEVSAPFGVKLEDQLLVTATGCEVLSTYPFDEKLLG
ncbi:MAG: M24 family metallopeptidase [Gaiellaceae bacterium]